MKKVLIKLFNFLYYIILMQLVIGILNFLPNLKYSNKIRGFFLKPFFKECGKNFQVAKGLIINVPRRVSIGENVYIAHNVWINGSGNISINDDVIISPNVVIATTKHQYVDGRISNKLSSLSSISIGEGSWIASNSTITMGVNIGRGCIIGANSSVTKSIPDYTFAGGVPAKKIKKIYHEVEREKKSEI